jgi:hypothetical protein
MRLTILFLMVVGVTATNASTTDVSGVWVAVIDRCDFGPASHPMRLVLNVTRDENRLKVIEVFNGEDGAVLAERQYALHRGLSPIRSAVGRARITGRTAILDSPERSDQWRISDDGSELIVTRRIRRSSTAHQQVLIFRRSDEILSTNPSAKSAVLQVAKNTYPYA